MPRPSSPGETARKHTDAGDYHPSLGARDCFLEVFGEAAISPEPRQGSLDDPASWFRLEGANRLAARDDLDRPFAELGDGIEELGTAVDAIGEEMPEGWKRTADGLEQGHRAMVVLDVGRMDLDGQQPTFGVGHQVTLAPLYSLGRIKPTWTATFRGLDALAVDDAGGGSGLASDRAAGAPDEHPVDATPQPYVAPRVEVILDARERWEVFGQGAPLASGGEDIKDRVEHRAKVNLARSPDLSGLGKQWRNQLPLLVGEVTCVTQAVAAILFAGGFGPRHVVLPRRISNTKESQRAETTQLLFGQALRMTAVCVAGCNKSPVRAAERHERIVEQRGAVRPVGQPGAE